MNSIFVLARVQTGDVVWELNERGSAAEEKKRRAGGSCSKTRGLVP